MLTLPKDLKIKVDDSTVLKLQTHEQETDEYQLIMDNYDYLKIWVFWVNDTFDLTALSRGIDENLESYQRGSAYTMRVYINDVLAGLVDVRDIVPNGSAEVGYWIAEQFAGRGLATKCTLRLIDYVRERHHVKNFYLLAMEDNTASSRVAEKMDFVFDKIMKNKEYDVREKRYVRNYG